MHSKAEEAAELHHAAGNTAITTDEIMHECLPHVGHHDAAACAAITTVGDVTVIDSAFWVNEAGIATYQHVAAEFVAGLVSLLYS